MVLLALTRGAVLKEQPGQKFLAQAQANSVGAILGQQIVGAASSQVN